MSFLPFNCRVWVGQWLYSIITNSLKRYFTILMLSPFHNEEIVSKRFSIWPSWYKTQSCLKADAPPHCANHITSQRKPMFFASFWVGAKKGLTKKELLVLRCNRDKSHHWKMGCVRWGGKNHVKCTSNRQILANRSLLLQLKQEKGRGGK